MHACGSSIYTTRLRIEGGQPVISAVASSRFTQYIYVFHAYIVSISLSLMGLLGNQLILARVPRGRAGDRSIEERMCLCVGILMMLHRKLMANKQRASDGFTARRNDGYISDQLQHAYAYRCDLTSLKLSMN